MKRLSIALAGLLAAESMSHGTHDIPSVPDCGRGGVPSSGAEGFAAELVKSGDDWVVHVCDSTQKAFKAGLSKMASGVVKTNKGEQKFELKLSEDGGAYRGTWKSGDLKVRSTQVEFKKDNKNVKVNFEG